MRKRRRAIVTVTVVPRPGSGKDGLDLRIMIPPIAQSGFDGADVRVPLLALEFGALVQEAQGGVEDVDGEEDVVDAEKLGDEGYIGALAGEEVAERVEGGEGGEGEL